VAGKRITVISTNKDVAELTERIRSRFLDTDMSVAAANQASDYRPARNLTSVDTLVNFVLQRFQNSFSYLKS
jgi:hypothetical protein